MVVGELAEAVDLLVIGGGPGGYVAALRAAQLGRDVLLVERNGGASGLGGTCLHVGCIPSKALIELADAKASLRRLASRGLSAGDVQVDLSVFQQEKARLVRELAAGVSHLLDRRGVRVVEGIARLTGTNRAAIECPTGPALFVEFRDVVLAAGSRPVSLAELPFDGKRILNSSDLLAQEVLPRSLAIIGGGVIGLEFASALEELGTSVIVVELTEQLLPGVDKAVSSVVHRAFKARGIDVRCGTRVLSDDGTALTLEADGSHETLPVEAVLVTVGRRPNSDDLGLALAGIAVAPDGTIPVGGDRLAGASVAAIGDLTAGPNLAHKAMAEGVVAAEALCGLPSSFDPAAVPAVIYSNPEIALIGETEAAARAAGETIRVSTVPMSVVPRGATMAASEGLARILSEDSTGRVRGVQLVGRHVSELAAEAALAIEMGATIEDLAATIHPHPSMSEAIAEAARLGSGAPLHAAA